MRKPSFLILVGLLVLSIYRPFMTNATLSPISVIGSTWGSQQSPIMVEPGTTNNLLTIYLTNFGSAPAQNITVTLSLSYPFSSSTNLGNISNIMSILPPSQTLASVFYLNIAANSTEGVYTLPLEVNYVELKVNFTLDTFVQLPVTTSPCLAVQNAFWGSLTSPILVGPGTENALLLLTIKNTGSNNALETFVTIDISSPFYYDAGGLQTEETAQLGVIPAGTTVPATFTLSVDSNISTGQYPLNVTLSCNNGIVAKQIVYIPILGSSNIVMQSYALQQNNMFPGDDNVGLLIYIVNSGNITANNVEAKLSIPTPLSTAYLGSNEMNLGTMLPLQPQLIKFFFNVPSQISSPCNLEFQLKISYNGQNHTFSIPLSVSSLSNFTESASKLPTLEQGSSNVNILLSITNTGNTTAKSVQAQLLLPNELSGTTFTFLGDVDPGASNLATFALDVSSSAPSGTYYGTLKITWLQDNAPGRQFSQDISLAFQIQTSLYSELVNDLAGVALYIAIVVIIVVALIILVLRRRK